MTNFWFSSIIGNPAQACLSGVTSGGIHLNFVMKNMSPSLVLKIKNRKWCCGSECFTSKKLCSGSESCEVDLNFVLDQKCFTSKKLCGGLLNFSPKSRWFLLSPPLSLYEQGGGTGRVMGWGPQYVMHQLHYFFV